MNRHLLFWFLTSLLTAISGHAIAGNDDAFLRARQAYYAQDAKEFERQAARVDKSYALYPYLQYWRISRDIKSAGDAAVAEFLASQPGTWLAERLRADWLKDLGRREMWPAYLPEYARLASPDMTHQCYARRAQLAAGDLSHLREAISLWFTGSDLPSACNPLFSRLISLGYLRQEDIWRRLRLTLLAGNPGVAKSVITALPPELRPDSATIDRASRDPETLLESGRLDLTRRADREVMLYALDLLAKLDPDQAAKLLDGMDARLPELDRHTAWGLVAVRAAWLHHAKALNWFQRAGTLAVSDGQREWWVRAALRAGQWRQVFEVIGSMGEAQQQAVWRYWKARALKNLGQTYAANALLGPLSSEFNYYGQLAAEELGPAAGNPVANIRVSGEEIKSLAKDPAIVRALALYHLGLRAEATEEWKWAIRNDDDRHLLAAAELARQQEWFDRAISTAEKTREQHSSDLRFLAPFREQASAYARKYQLDEAWIYGVMRQESRFALEARSGTGAMGLMQLMPDTARWIARKLGLSHFKAYDAHDPDTNIKFGAYYLRTLMDAMDNQAVLATAAYNAGPRRAQRWRDERAMEGAIYIESIPFNETREYVKKVMSNAMFYAVRFGQPSSLLKDRLGAIPALAQPVPLAITPDDKSPAQHDESGGG
ncbi:MAG TPA: transglycosylase SLT domain-containing protein [Thiobacillaceae bacterium]|nr:transglycosylase SLT domain-containing protein [Thiobacillaceae bacterium]